MLRGGAGLLGPLEEESPSPGAESSTDSESSDDSEPGPVFACEQAWFVAWNGSSPVEIQRVFMFACEHAWFVAWNDPRYAFLHTRMLCGSVRYIQGVHS